MDWEECIRQRIVKTASEDRNLIKSTREIARAKIESADALPDHLYIGKINKPTAESFFITRNR